jgi:glycosyltransferase involved in cell wall biosynthesis
MDRIRILYVIGSYGVGGKERQLAELIKGLPKESYSICFIAKNADAYYMQSIESTVDYFYSLRQRRFGISALFKIFRIIREFRPDIVHSWASIATFHTIIVRGFIKFKLIDGSIRDSTKPGLFARIITKMIIRFSDKIIANSKAGLDCYKIPAIKGTFIHNGFDLKRIKNLESNESIRGKFNIKTTKIVGMVARINSEKDYPTFIMAALVILKSRTTVTFVIVGDGEDMDKIKAMIPLTHKNSFVFTGSQSNIESIVNCFDLAVLATFTEGISNSIMEYMALGKPVIATEGGGTSEIVLNEINGFLVQQGDEIQLAEQIQVLLDNPDLSEKMGSEGKNLIIEKFGFDKMINAYNSEYKNMMVK